jgi:hypothetical protein
VCSEIAGHINVIELTMQVILAVAAVCFFHIGFKRFPTTTPNTRYQDDIKGYTHMYITTVESYSYEIKFISIIAAFMLEILNWTLIYVSYFSSPQKYGTVTALLAICGAYYLLLFLVHAWYHWMYRFGNINERHKIKFMCIQLVVDFTLITLIYVAIN